VFDDCVMSSRSCLPRALALLHDGAHMELHCSISPPQPSRLFEGKRLHEQMGGKILGFNYHLVTGQHYTMFKYRWTHVK